VYSFDEGLLRMHAQGVGHGMGAAALQFIWRLLGLESPSQKILSAKGHV
jgi:hypothetical protein